MVNVSAECWPLYRPRYLLIVSRYVNQNSADTLVDIGTSLINTSTDILVKRCTKYTWSMMFENTLINSYFTWEIFLNPLCFGNLWVQFWTGVRVESEAWWWNNRVLCKSIAGFIVATESIFTPLLGTLKTHWGLGVRLKPSENAARENLFWGGLTTEYAKVPELTWIHPQSQCHFVNSALAFMYKLSWLNPMHRIVWKLSAIWNAWNSIVGKTYSAEMHCTSGNVSLKVSTLCHCFSIPTQVGAGGVSLVLGKLRVESWSSVLEKMQKYHWA